MTHLPFLSNKINVVCIAYRDKSFIEMIENAISTAKNKNRLSFIIMCQDSFQRKYESDVSEITIQYKPWDDHYGFAYTRNLLMNHVHPDSYILSVMPGVEFKENWDVDLINYASENPGFITDSSNKINPEFMFFNKNLINKIGYPKYLKMDGESEDLSIRAYCYNIKVNEGLGQFVTNSEKREYDYIPFSKNHKYNEVEMLYKNGSNSFCDLRMCQNDFNKYASENKLKRIFDQLDDVSYTPETMPMLKPSRYNKGKTDLT